MSPYNSIRCSKKNIKKENLWILQFVSLLIVGETFLLREQCVYRNFRNYGVWQPNCKCKSSTYSAFTCSDGSIVRGFPLLLRLCDVPTTVGGGDTLTTGHGTVMDGVGRKAHGHVWRWLRPIQVSVLKCMTATLWTHQLRQWDEVQKEFYTLVRVICTAISG